MINSVRKTVQAVLNKNNYGYISPDDFNLYAKQAQMEIFEEYFTAYNKVVNMENARMAGGRQTLHSERFCGRSNGRIKPIVPDAASVMSGGFAQKRSLQSLAVAPRRPFDKDAANGGSEPNSTDAALRINGHKLRKAAVRPS